jgi:hypothetical protein
MKYAEIFMIKDALQKLGKERLTVAFEIAKNIRACDKVLNEAQEIAKELHQKYADKDEKGEVKQYPDDKGQMLTKISDPALIKDYQVELAKLDTEEHEVVFTKIKKSQISAEKIPGEILVPLIDTVLVEE